MPNDLVIQSLLPGLNNTSLVQDKLRSSTFIGIDFGTYLTGASVPHLNAQFRKEVIKGSLGLFQFYRTASRF